MDFGDEPVVINVQPFASSIFGGVFGDFKPFDPMICSPPPIFQENNNESEICGNE
jgi:hypothetical protein